MHRASRAVRASSSPGVCRARRPSTSVAPMNDDSSLDRRALVARALKRYHARLARKVEALRGGLAEARRASEYRTWGETLLAYLRQVPPRAPEVALPDPANPARNLIIALDPAIAPQANAARYFKRAAKSERGLKE